MGVTFTDNSREYLKKVETAIDKPGGALDAATQHVAAKAQESMPGSGAAVRAGTGGDTGVRSKFISSTPGQPPGVRDNTLRGSLTNARVGTLRWAAGTNVEYARIQEFGGTINHPGGTHWIMTSDGPRFIKEQTALNLALKGQPLNKTKPHPITLPARPFLRPALNNNHKGTSREFNRRLKQLMGGGA